jgi:hypothetical protein
MKHFIQQVFTEVLENPVFDPALIDKYFSKQYVQLVDHTRLNYDEFVLHIQKLKEKTAGQKVEILNHAENGNIIFTNHVVRSVLKDGSMVSHKVLAEFTIKDDQIIRCDELTFLMEGDHIAKNLGSEK